MHQQQQQQSSSASPATNHHHHQLMSSSTFRSPLPSSHHNNQHLVMHKNNNSNGQNVHTPVSASPSLARSVHSAPTAATANAARGSSFRVSNAISHKLFQQQPSAISDQKATFKVPAVASKALPEEATTTCGKISSSSFRRKSKSDLTSLTHSSDGQRNKGTSVTPAPSTRSKSKRMSNIFPNLSVSKNRQNNSTAGDNKNSSDFGGSDCNDSSCNELGVGRAIPVSLGS